LQIHSETISTLPIDFFLFSTDASGQITAWAIELADNSGPSSGCAPVLATGGEDICLGTASSNGDYTGYDFNHGLPDEAYGAGQNHVAGNWTVVTIAIMPEPASIVLLCTGGLVALLGHRRFRWT
jgi:hypothetical protein